MAVSLASSTLPKPAVVAPGASVEARTAPVVNVDERVLNPMLDVVTGTLVCKFVLRGVVEEVMSRIMVDVIEEAADGEIVLVSVPKRDTTFVVVARVLFGRPEFSDVFSAICSSPSDAYVIVFTNVVFEIADEAIVAAPVKVIVTFVVVFGFTRVDVVASAPVVVVVVALVGVGVVHVAETEFHETERLA